MNAAHLIIGLPLLIAGATLILRRQRLAQREAQRGRTVMGPTGWVVLGGIFALNGVLQVAIAFA